MKSQKFYDNHSHSRDSLRPRRNRSHRGIATAAGFTLIEVMVTLAVIAVLATLSAPYFRDLMMANQLTSNANNLVLAALAGRVEAIKRNQQIRISALDASSAGNEWGPGLVVYVDNDASSTFTVGDEEIRTISAVPSAHTVNGPNGVTGFGFLPSGEINSTSVPLVLQVCDNRSSETGRSVTITGTGQVRATDLNCT